MMIQHEKTLRTTSYILALVSLPLFITSCAFAPGMQTSAILQDNLKNNQKNQVRTHNNANSTNKDIENISTKFTTKSGVSIEFQDLDKNNIPQIPKISYNSANNIKKLLKSKSYGDYRIAAGDSISINSWLYPEIFGNNGSVMTVSQSGYIYIPLNLIGKIKAAGKTKQQLRNELRKKYAKYLKEPEIELKIVTYNSRHYSVQGKVRTEGEFLISDRPVNLMTAISQAGGLLENADANQITINRAGRNYKFGLPQLREMGISTSDISLQDGDTIHVESNDNREVHLMGEVGNPITVKIPENGFTLANALGRSAGLNNQTANAAKVYVVRSQKDKGNTQIYRLNLSKLENLALANEFKMAPNDIVYVDASGLTRWNRVIGQITSSTNFVRMSQMIGGL